MNTKEVDGMSKTKPFIVPMNKDGVKPEDLAEIMDAVFEDAYRKGFTDGYQSGVKDTLYKQIKDEEYESNKIKEINEFARSKKKPLRG